MRNSSRAGSVRSGASGSTVSGRAEVALTFMEIGDAGPCSLEPHGEDSTQHGEAKGLDASSELAQRERPDGQRGRKTAREPGHLERRLAPVVLHANQACAAVAGSRRACGAPRMIRSTR